MDIEAVDRELARFIEKRAKGREMANRVEESWKEPTRRRHRQRQRETAEAWVAYYRSMAISHHDMAAQLSAKADDLAAQLGEQPKGAA